MKKSRKNAIKRFFSLRWLALGPIMFYRKCISPLTPSVCIYYPSCSAYMLEAVEKFGLIKGVMLGLKRLSRCVPWQKGGFDPVPDNPKGDMKWLF